MARKEEIIVSGLRVSMSILLVSWIILNVCAGDADAKEVLTGKAAFRDYQVRVFRDNESGEGRVVILRGKKIELDLKSEDAGWFRIGHLEADKRHNSAIQAGKDITGKGIPNLVISWASQCCNAIYVYELGDRISQAAKLEMGRYSGHFEDVDSDGRPEFITVDGLTWSGWNASLADSAAPAVILKYSNGSYRLAPELIRKPAPWTLRLADLARSIRADASGDRADGLPPVRLWKTMLDLIYTGNADTAWKFLDFGWPKEMPGKDAFLADFKARLRTSPYWGELSRMNNIP